MRYYFESVINLLITIQQVLKHWHGARPDEIKMRAKRSHCFFCNSDKLGSCLIIPAGSRFRTKQCALVSKAFFISGGRTKRLALSDRMK